MRKIVLVISTLMMTACGRYDFFTPNETPAIPENWDSEDQAYTNSDTNLACFPWWEQFDDPALNALVNEGLLFNNNIQVALANIEASQGELKRIQLNWIPGITANAGYSSFPDMGFPGVIVNIVPSYILNIYKQIEEQKRAGFELKISRALHDSVRLAIIAQIATNYFKLVSQIEQFELLSAIERDLQSLLDIAHNMYEDGLYPMMNTDRATSELYLIQAKKKFIQHHIVIYQNTIQYLLDRNPGFLDNVTKFNQLNGSQIVVGALPIEVIENRPDMRQAAYELKAANTGIRIAFSNLLPTIESRIARGEIATKDNGVKLGKAIHFNEGLLEVPVLKPSVFGELDLSAHDLYSQRFDEVSQAEKSLGEDYALNEGLYETGVISQTDLWEKNIKLYHLRLEVNQSKLDKLLSVVDLYHDLGVGYQYQPASCCY